MLTGDHGDANMGAEAITPAGVVHPQALGVIIRRALRRSQQSSPHLYRQHGQISTTDIRKTASVAHTQALGFITCHTLTGCLSAFCSTADGPTGTGLPKIQSFYKRREYAANRI